LSRRVATGVCSPVAERFGERRSETLVVGFQVADPFGCDLQALVQGRVGGALPVGDRGGGWLLSAA